jgi:hypothetical protein
LGRKKNYLLDKFSHLRICFSSYGTLQFLSNGRQSKPNYSRTSLTRPPKGPITSGRVNRVVALSEVDQKKRNFVQIYKYSIKIGKIIVFNELKQRNQQNMIINREKINDTRMFHFLCSPPKNVQKIQKCLQKISKKSKKFIKIAAGRVIR